jgi:hypothetical protein
MKAVGVMVTLFYEALVDGEGTEARRLAESVVAARLRVLGVRPEDINDIEAAGVLPPADDARSETTTCSHCKVISPKLNWGPGWMSCPSCGKRPPSASESIG